MELMNVIIASLSIEIVSHAVPKHNVVNVLQVNTFINYFLKLKYLIY